MQTIQVELDDILLNAADLAAEKENIDRSDFIRQALAERLDRLRVSELEERDQRGYQANPQKPEEYLAWEAAAVWPD